MGFVGFVFVCFVIVGFIVVDFDDYVLKKI